MSLLLSLALCISLSCVPVQSHEPSFCVPPSIPKGCVSGASGSVIESHEFSFSLLWVAKDIYCDTEGERDRDAYHVCMHIICIYIHMCIYIYMYIYLFHLDLCVQSPI